MVSSYGELYSKTSKEVEIRFCFGASRNESLMSVIDVHHGRLSNQRLGTYIESLILAQDERWRRG